MMCHTIHSARADDLGGARQRGFTLTEMLVVVAIVGLIAVIGMPNLHRASIRADLLQEVKMVRQALAVARINAIKSSRGVAVSLIPGDTAQPGHTVLAWFDDDGDEILDAGDQLVGRWYMGVKTLVGPDSDSDLSLNPMPGGGAGVVFSPDGTALVHGTEIGIGMGSVVISDLKNNRIRLLIAGGSGTVQEEMWNPDLNTWSNEFRFWRY